MAATPGRLKDGENCSTILGAIEEGKTDIDSIHEAINSLRQVFQQTDQQLRDVREEITANAKATTVLNENLLKKDGEVTLWDVKTRAVESTCVDLEETVGRKVKETENARSRLFFMTAAQLERSMKFAEHWNCLTAGRESRRKQLGSITSDYQNKKHALEMELHQFLTRERAYAHANAAVSELQEKVSRDSGTLSEKEDELQMKIISARRAVHALEKEIKSETANFLRNKLELLKPNAHHAGNAQTSDCRPPVEKLYKLDENMMSDTSHFSEQRHPHDVQRTGTAGKPPSANPTGSYPPQFTLKGTNTAASSVQAPTASMRQSYPAPGIFRHDPAVNVASDQIGVGNVRKKFVFKKPTSSYDRSNANAGALDLSKGN